MKYDFLGVVVFGIVLLIGVAVIAAFITVGIFLIAGKDRPPDRPHLLHDREPCDRSKRPRLLAGKGLQGGGLIRCV